MTINCFNASKEKHGRVPGGQKAYPQAALSCLYCPQLLVFPYKKWYSGYILYIGHPKRSLL